MEGDLMRLLDNCFMLQTMERRAYLDDKGNTLAVETRSSRQDPWSPTCRRESSQESCWKQGELWQH